MLLQERVRFELRPRLYECFSLGVIHSNMAGTMGKRLFTHTILAEIGAE